MACLAHLAKRDCLVYTIKINDSGLLISRFITVPKLCFFWSVGSFFLDFAGRGKCLSARAIGFFNFRAVLDHKHIKLDRLHDCFIPWKGELYLCTVRFRVASSREMLGHTYSIFEVSDNVFLACTIYKVMKPCTPHRSPAQCTHWFVNVGDIEIDEARLPTCLILFCPDLLEECLREDVIF